MSASVFHNFLPKIETIIFCLRSFSFAILTHYPAKTYLHIYLSSLGRYTHKVSAESLADKTIPMQSLSCPSISMKPFPTQCQVHCLCFLLYSSFFFVSSLPYFSFLYITCCISFQILLSAIREPFQERERERERERNRERWGRQVRSMVVLSCHCTVPTIFVVVSIKASLYWITREMGCRKLK